MATKNVQLKNFNGDLLMPKTNDESVYRIITNYVSGGSRKGDGESYITVNLSTVLAQNTTYKIIVESDSNVEDDCDITQNVGNTPISVIATMTSGTSSVESTFNTGANSINKIQVRKNLTSLFTVRIYSYIEEALPTHLATIEDSVNAINDELHNSPGKGFVSYSKLASGTNQTGTIYVLNPLPHWVVPSLYCKLVVSDIESTGTVTVNAIAGTSKVMQIGQFGSSDAVKTFYFQPSKEFNKIQFQAGTKTVSHKTQLFVMSNFYRDAELHRDYNTLSALYRSGVKCIAHQGFSIDQYTASCRKSAIIAAAVNHFDGVEVDIVFSSDDVPFLCHDASFVSGGDTIVIANETADDLLTYSYYGETICTLDEAVRLCKLYGMDIILDHTSSISNQARATAVVNIINKYRAWDNVIWTTSSSVLNRNAILTLYPQARFHVVSDNAISETNISNVNTLAEQGYNVILSFNYTKNTVSHLQENVLPNLDARVKLSCYTLDNTSNTMASNNTLYNSYLPYVDYALSNLNNKFRADTGYVNIYNNTES